MPQASFDNYASQYDADFTFSSIGTLQRMLVYKNLIPLLNKDKRVLELNCGTGHDALEISKHVQSVLATDASAEMIAVCRSKIKEPTLTPEFEVLRVQDINSKLEDADFIFSNFAGLNCLNGNELKDFAKNCCETKTKELDLFFVFLSRKCIWERIYFLLKLNPTKAFRRNSIHGVTTRIGSSEFFTWYYSPKEIKKIFAKGFYVQSHGPIGLFVPPSYLGSFFKNKNNLLKRLGALDKFFCNFKFASNFGDHFYIHLKKTN